MARIAGGSLAVGGLAGAPLWLGCEFLEPESVQVTWNELVLGLLPLELVTAHALGRRFAQSGFPGATAASFLSSLPDLPGIDWEESGARWRGDPWIVPPAIEHAVREQFAAADAVVIDSWVLSRLEATLCAISAFAAASASSRAPTISTVACSKASSHVS